MSKSVKSRAEKLFSATQTKEKRVLKENEIARQERAEQTVRLRALRLAKEAADKEAAEEAEPKASSTAQHDLSGVEAQGTIDKHVEEDLLEIPSSLRR
jgi:hypothetical protein